MAVELPAGAVVERKEARDPLEQTSVMKKLIPYLLLALAAGCGPSGPMAPSGNFEPLDQPGKVIELESLRGKPVLIDFWATWCGPCRDTMPIIQQMHEKYASRGLQVVAISDEDRETVRAFKKGKPYTYPVFIDFGGTMNQAFKVSGIPYAVVINSSGQVIYTGHPGDALQLEAAVKSVL
ncbi:MAG TPA: TlpA disulfide reductase family protein [Fimbriimonadaceae bacterium]|nr:TlpA disulfide reductase family protein [Fimbriimonadaceae bacterium]